MTQASPKCAGPEVGQLWTRRPCRASARAGSRGGRRNPFHWPCGASETLRAGSPWYILVLRAGSPWYINACFRNLLVYGAGSPYHMFVMRAGNPWYILVLRAGSPWYILVHWASRYSNSMFLALPSFQVI